MKISEGSKFIFIATSSKHLEDRFLYDVNYGVTILKNQGVARRRYYSCYRCSKRNIDSKMYQYVKRVLFHVFKF